MGGLDAPGVALSRPKGSGPSASAGSARTSGATPPCRRAASRSCNAKSSLSVPSIFGARAIVRVTTSTSCAVMRSRSPTRWNPPLITQRTPSPRPSSASRDGSTGASDPPAARIASDTCSEPMMSNVKSRCRSTESVSAMPALIQSSAGAPVMFTNGKTATRARAPFAEEPSPCPRAGETANRSATHTIPARTPSLRDIWASTF